jgi:NitT/TauT family transport system ATP-binding protein
MRLSAMHIRAVRRKPIAGAAPAVSMRGLGLTFAAGSARRRQVFANIDLDVDTAEFVCIVGPSGSEKTTLLRMLAGLAHRTAGELRFHGKSSTGPSRERAIIFQVQDYSKALLPWRTVEANVALSLEARRITRSQQGEIIAELLAKMRLEHAAQEYPGQLSCGVQQRVQIELGLYRSTFDPEKLGLPQLFAGNHWTDSGRNA